MSSMPSRRLVHACLAALACHAASPCSTVAASAQGASSGPDRELSFHVDSAALGETRGVDVYLPKGYGSAGERYFTAYVLDGEESFHYAAGILDALYQSGYPKIVLVSVPNTHRSRDLTPAPWREAPSGGGADRFLQFLRDELRPVVDARFLTDGYRLLVGHSFGGLFAIHVLSTAPDAFDAYLAISPSVFYADGQPLATLIDSFAEDRSRSIELYVAMGAEPGSEGDSIHRLYSALALQAPPWLNWRFRRFGEEDHSSVPVIATLDGLRTIFAPFVPDVQAMNGSLDTLRAHYQRLSARYGKPIRAPQRVLLNLGAGQMESGDLDDAVETFEHYAAVYPAMVLPLDMLAEVHRRRGDREAAITALRRLLDIAPGHRDAAEHLRALQANGTGIEQ